jgi:hypothetical protein
MTISSPEENRKSANRSNSGTALGDWEKRSIVGDRKSLTNHVQLLVGYNSA